MMTEDIDHPKFDIEIKTKASPHEVVEFVEMVSDHGYEVVTDLSHGRIRVSGEIPSEDE